MKEKLKITLKEYSYSCGDRCCYKYGTITTINGEELPCHNQDSATIVRQILEYLGYEIEIKGEYDLD